MVTIARAKFYNIRPIESLIHSLNDRFNDEVTDRLSGMEKNSQVSLKVLEPLLEKEGMILGIANERLSLEEKLSDVLNK